MKKLDDEIAYLAPPGLEHLLARELSDVTHQYGRLFLARGVKQDAYWWRNIWLTPTLISFQSISEAARSLRAIQRNWWPYGFHHHRRMQLIGEQLPSVSAKPLNFLEHYKSAPLGSWTLIDEHTMLASPECISPMPNGEWNFVEDKVNPPSRAYLKLWELFTRFRVFPNKTETCLDLGACPGGWTYVLAGLAKSVIAYDRSPLDPSVMALKNVSFRAQDAFKVKLSDHPEVSWVFSDVICFPEKLYEFVSSLLREFPEKKYVFTIKFRGDDHAEVIARFRTLPGQLVHLSNNKHELMWMKL